MSPYVRILALLHLLSGCLGAACGCGSVLWAVGWVSELVPRALAESGLNPHASGTPGQVATGYFVAACVLAFAAVPQWVAAYALFRGRPWARAASLVGSFAGLATCLPAGMIGFALALRMPRAGEHALPR